MKANRKRMPIILICLCALSIFSVGIMLITIRARAPDIQTPEFTPPPFEPLAGKGTPEPPGNIMLSAVEIEPDFRVILNGDLTANGTKIDLYLTSPDTNNVWLLLRMTDESGEVLCQTGLIRPGEFLESVTLEHPLTSELPVNLKMIAYQPETYISMGTAGLNMTIKLSE